MTPHTLPEDWPPEDALRPPGESAPVDLDRLAAAIAPAGLVLDREREARQFRGGLANVNHVVSVNGRPAVLRRAPAGPLPPGAHDMAREHRVLSRLHRALPLAPESFFLCEDPAVLGAPFQLIAYRDGRVVRGDDLGDLAAVPAIGERLTDAMVDTLLAIHAVDAGAVGLADLGRPDGFVERAAKGWVRRGEAVAEGAAARDTEAVASWLAANVERAPRNAPVLIHNDFKLDNLILSRTVPEPVAVVDWDMATRGERLFDLATLLSYWSEANDPDCMIRLRQMPTAGHGFPPRMAVAERYAERAGVSLAGFDVLMVLAVFKLGVVFLQLHARWRDGALGVGDERYRAFGPLGTEIVAFARSEAR